MTGAHELHTLTTRLVNYIEEESFNIHRNFSQIADETGVNELIIRNIFTARGKQLDELPRTRAPWWIGIDEVYPRSKKEPRCVITAPDQRRVIDLLSTNVVTGYAVSSKKSRSDVPEVTKNKQIGLAEWLMALPGRLDVLLVTIDMWEPYRKIIRLLLPNALIVVDRYHVHNLLSVALKQVMEVVRCSMTESEIRRYMRREELLLKNHHKLSTKRKVDKTGKELPSEFELVEKWLHDVPDIAAAYRLVCDFSDILQLSDRQKAEDRTSLWLKRASDFVDDFRDKYQKQHRGKWLDPFGNVPHTITAWRASILNYIDAKKRFNILPTNGFAEFANKQIKKAFIVANGCSFQVLRHKVVHGGVIVKKRPPHHLEVKRTRQRRRPEGGKEKPRETNSNANIIILEKARRESYGTADLLPNPEENSGWVDRFGSIDLSQLQLEESGEQAMLPITVPPEQRTREAEAESQPSNTEGRCTRRRIKYHSEQYEMF